MLNVKDMYDLSNHQELKELVEEFVDTIEEGSTEKERDSILDGAISMLKALKADPKIVC